MPRAIRWTVLVVLLAAVGCGGGDRPKLVGVTGKVLYKGQPLTAGSVTFHPAPGFTYNGDRPSSVLQVDGSFTLQTYPHGTGAPPGSYKVTLSSELAGRLNLTPYASAEKTPLTLEVPESGVSGHTFEVK